MADLAHKKATAAANKAPGKGTPDSALVTLARALAQDAAEEHFKAESGAGIVMDSAQNLLDQRS